MASADREAAPGQLGTAPADTVTQPLAGLRRGVASSAAGRGVAIGVGLLTVFCVGIAAANGNPVSTKPFVPGDTNLGPIPVDTRPPGGAQLLPRADSPPWLEWLLQGFVWLCGLAIVGMLVVLVLRMLSGLDATLVRRRVLEPEEVMSLTAHHVEIDTIGRGRDLSNAVDEGMVALAEGNDVRAAVITAWLRLEDAAAVAGTPRRDDDAPGDFVGRLLTTHDVRPRRLRDLAELYRRARFSPAPMDEDDRNEAQRALRDVREDLLGPADPGAGSWRGRPDGADGRWPTRWT